MTNIIISLMMVTFTSIASAEDLNNCSMVRFVQDGKWVKPVEIFKGEITPFSYYIIDGESVRKSVTLDIDKLQETTLVFYISKDFAGEESLSISRKSEVFDGQFRAEINLQIFKDDRKINLGYDLRNLHIKCNN